MKKIEAYAQLVALQAIWKNAPADQRHLIEPFIVEEIRHIKAVHMIERTDKIMKLSIVAVVLFMCLTTFFAKV